MNRIDKGIQEANEAVNKVLDRRYRITQQYGISDYEITARVEMERIWEQNRKRQERENFCKWLMLVCAVTIIVVLALVYTGNL